MKFTKAQVTSIIEAMLAATLTSHDAALNMIDSQDQLIETPDGWKIVLNSYIDESLPGSRFNRRAVGQVQLKLTISAEQLIQMYDHDDDDPDWENIK